ncbi:MAG: hypothetical protein OXI88_20805 [Gammaproteobacteria bacterium]|nr:hypothetical protein [Gammaproteobacteria bacterium]MDE0514215.1 hypothetical protein [Gammaproteobacteria bacterium]
MTPQQVNSTETFGVSVFPAGSIGKYIPFLQSQLATLFNGTNKTRPWHLWELHNPWSRSALVAESWKFLDLCQSAELLQRITTFLGEDIILFDSQFSPDLCDTGKSAPSWNNDRLRCPVTPLHGLVVRIPVPDQVNAGATFSYKTERRGKQVIDYNSGHIICHKADLDYRIEGIESPEQPLEYVIRYFPATSRYLRDPAATVHRQLTEQYPLLNYAQMPLWLVQGEDRAGNDFVTGFQPKAGRWIGEMRQHETLC